MRNAGFGQMTKYRSLGIAFNYAELLKKMQADEPQNIKDEKWYRMLTHKEIDYSEVEEERGNIYHLNVIRRVLGTAWKYNQKDQIVLDLNTMTITISYYGETLVKFYPDGRVIFAKLWGFRNEVETKKRVDFIANGNGGSVYQKDFTWYLSYGNGEEHGTRQYGVTTDGSYKDSLLNGTYEQIKNDDNRYPKQPEYWY